MKLDKETFVKHQFWFLLGGYLLFWFIAVLWLKFSVPGEIKKVEEAYKSNKKGLEGASTRPINASTFIPPWQDYGRAFDKHKRVIWDQAWQLQQGMYDWPYAKDMATPQTPLDQDEREEFKRKLYPDEIKALKDWTPKLLGPVELAGGFEDLFKPQKWSETPTREEMWLTQEDYWVKRELLWVIGGSVASQAFLYRENIDDKKEEMPKGVLARYRYRNQNWELTLLIKPNKDNLPVIAGDSTIKNVQASQQPLSLTSAKGTGIVFNVYQDRTVAAFEVRGEPVPFGVPQRLSKEDYRPLNGIDWSKTKDHPVSLTQAFDWATCPVRRIEAIEIAKQSSRTHTMGLFPNETLAKLDPTGETPEDANKQGGGNPPGGGGMGMQGGGPRGPGGGAGGMGGAGPGMGPGAGPGGPGGTGGPPAPAGNLTPNNQIDRDRYLQPPKVKDEAEKPSRHLPIALQLIVDQSHVHDLLVALANSRLRIQITQVDLQRLQGGLKQQDKNGSQLRTGGFFMAGMDGAFGGNPRMRPDGMRGPRMPMGPGPMMPRGGNPRGGNMAPPGMGPMMPPGGRGGSFAPPKILRPGNVPMGPMGPMGDTPTEKSAGGGDDENLVEVTVYGIAALYRKPDPPKTDGQGGQPGVQPGQTIPPTPPAGTTPPTTTPAGTTPAGTPAATTPPTGTTPAGTTPPTGTTPADKKDDKKADEKKDDEKKPADKKDDEKKTDGKAPPEKKG